LRRMHPRSGCDASDGPIPKERMRRFGRSISERAAADEERPAACLVQNPTQVPVRGRHFHSGIRRIGRWRKGGEMKTTAVVVPAMVLLLGASAFYLNEARGDTKDEYAKLVETARMYAENGIKGDAVTKYKEALSISSSFELALEAGEVYLQEDDYRGAQKWYEDVLSAEYPRDARTYEFGIEAYVAKKDYEEAFEAYDVYESRCREKSEKVEELLEEIEYTYGVTGNFTDHGEFGASSGLAAAESEGLWGYVDSKGNFKIKKGYVSAGFMGTSAPVVNAKGSAYYIYKDGTVAYTHEDFEKANPDFGKNRAVQGMRRRDRPRLQREGVGIFQRGHEENALRGLRRRDGDRERRRSRNRGRRGVVPDRGRRQTDRRRVLRRGLR